MKRKRGSTIDRVLDILDTIASSDKPISSTEINQVLNLPKATAHRLCAALESRGYLLKKINGRSYMPGKKLHDMAVGVLAHSQFRTERHAILQSLSEDIGETCNIAIAVPITDNQGRFYSSLAFQAPTFRLTLEDAQQHIPRLRKAAQDLSALADE
ncbi:MAG: helix-turn-helix domain-containing protein [Gammaproteobacteria bacterium]